MHSILNYIKESDLGLFFLFNQRLNCFTLDIFMQFITQLGSLCFAIFLPLAFLLSTRSELVPTGLQMAVVLAVSQMIVQLIKRIVNRPRPYKSLTNVIAKRIPACVYSFPSGHTSAAFSLALVLGNGFPGLHSMFLVLASFVGMSRIYLGVHYPTDVVVGFVIAYGAFILERTWIISALFLS